ncbi:MAG: hypothetical protein JNM25_02635 [Planctomycetes bacterium]|nr:hypothetical protein [Planctomycetota bacterium]
MPFLRGLAVAALLLSGIAAQDVPKDAVARVLERGKCQTVLPGEHGAPGGSGAPPPRAEPTRRGERSGAPGGFWSSGGLGLGPDFAVTLLWLGVPLAAVLLIAAIARSWRGRREPATVAARVRAAPVPDPGPAPEPLPDHERLAAAGEFGAAVHALLQRAFAAWMAQRGGLPPHATGRAALGLVRKQAATTEPLAQLVAAVERVHFGGRPADRAQYETSRLHLQQWEVACRPAK